MLTLTGKIAIVTGAASGIGFSTVVAFLAAGVAGVCMVDLTMETLEAALSRLPAGSEARVLLVEADVSNEAETQNYVDITMLRWGRLDVSIQNAGIIGPDASILDLPASQFDHVISINLRGCFLGLKASAKAMLASAHRGKGASIVLCSSQLGLDGSPNHSAYAASKFAVRGLAVTCAAELGRSGIRVNSVCPGPIVTPLSDEFYANTPGSRESAEDQTMVGRLGAASEVANAFLYLASDASSYVTGTSLKVDGGFSRWC